MCLDIAAAKLLLLVDLAISLLLVFVQALDELADGRDLIASAPMASRADLLLVGLLAVRHVCHR